jgi:GntR family transcriptional regulator, transcriptional repressor for pyruvate dehydrogenase complex
MVFQPIRPKKVSAQIAEQIRSSIYLTEEDHRNLFLHHRAVFEAIRDRDAERARDAMLTHLTFAKQRSSAYVTQQQR